MAAIYFAKWTAKNLYRAASDGFAPGNRGQLARDIIIADHANDNRSSSRTKSVGRPLDVLRKPKKKSCFGLWLGRGNFRGKATTAEREQAQTGRDQSESWPGCSRLHHAGRDSG